jgi:hypothetical protein
MKLFLITAVLVSGILLSFQSESQAAKRGLIIKDEATFYSYTAQQANNPGTPVGPKPKVQICHKGRTITVALASVPGHLSHGDTIGPCPPRTNTLHPGGSSGRSFFNFFGGSGD